MPESQRDGAKIAVDGIVDRSVEEIVILLEEFAATMGTLMRCLLCAPMLRRELDQVLTKFCRTTMDYFDVDFVALFEHVEETRELITSACTARGVSLSRDKRIMLGSFSVAAEAIAKRKVMFCDERHLEPSAKRRMLGQYSFLNCVAIPMVSGEKVVGLFFIGDSSRTVTLSSDELDMAEDLAKNILRVVENADLFERLSIRARAQRALIDVAATLQQEIESSEIFRVVASKLEELVPCNELTFYVFDWKRGTGTPVYATGPYAAEAMSDTNFPADVGIVGHVARTKKAEIIMDTEADPRGDLIPGTPATHARMLAVPIIGKKEVLGVIELLRYPPDNFSNEDLEIAIMFANHAGIAIENAKLLGEIATTREQIELHMDLLTHDIANYATPIIAYMGSISKEKDLDPRIQTIIGRTSGQSENLMMLLDMVRTLAKLREGGSKVFKKADAGQSITSAIESVKRNGRGRKIDFDVKLPSHTMDVLADEMLEDAFVDLFFTAVKSDRVEKTKLIITVDTKSSGRKEHWWIKVSQPDRGIPDHLKQEVLKMAKISRSELAGGFGIGLATARAIIERFNGEMWVSDIVKGDPSKGCVYNITLPKAT
jgi:GAF domain-containing protein